MIHDIKDIPMKVSFEDNFKMPIISLRKRLTALEELALKIDINLESNWLDVNFEKNKVLVQIYPSKSKIKYEDIKIPNQYELNYENNALVLNFLALGTRYAFHTSPKIKNSKK